MPQLIDLTGQRFGSWVVVERDISPSTKSRGAYWICRCDCGSTKSVSGKTLRRGQSKSCGCKDKYYHSLGMDKVRDERGKEAEQKIGGKRFGKLVAISLAEYKVIKRKNYKEHQRMWLCQCDCGNQAIVSERELLNKRGTRSCGCSHHVQQRKRPDDVNFDSLQNKPTIEEIVNICLGRQKNTPITTHDINSVIDDLFSCWWAKNVRIEQNTRRDFLEARDNKPCALCGNVGKLELHHRQKVKDYGGNEPSNVVFLCHGCHRKVERGEATI